MKANIRNTNAEEEKRKAVCLEQLALDRQKLLMRWPFIGGIIMRMELVPVRDDRLETACTDGNTIFVDINFYSTLNKDERLFVLAHEVWHSVLLHFARKGSRDAQLFNVAADLEIHFALAEEKMREPWVLSHNPKWKGLSTEEIYEKLVADRQKDDSGSSSADSGKGGTPQKGNGSFDRHIYSDTDVPDDLGEAAQKNGGKKNSSKAEETPEIVFDNDYTPSLSEDTAERVRSRVVAAAQQMERTCGNVPGQVARLLEELLQPQLLWQELLKQFVSSCYGGKRRWLPPSRRHVWHGLYLPSMREEALKAAVALDTSGSTHEDLKVFFSELVALMKSFGRYDLTVIQCDAEIQNVEKFTDAQPPRKDREWQIHGNGGTDFRPVFDYFNKKEKEKPDVLIYLTDGYGPAPENPPPYPVLWLLTKDGRPPCGWGKTVQMKQ